MASRRITPSLAFAAFAAAAGAQDLYYVHGVNGRDAPGYGSSPTTPWKTLTYAFTQIPRPAHPDGHTLLVAGGQTYAPATNGETFPIRPTYNVAVVGMLDTSLPRFEVASGNAFELDPNTVYNRDQSRFEFLVFAGYGGGVRMAPQAGIRHRPSIRQCEFLGTNGAGISLDVVAGSIADPRIFACRFVSLNLGIGGGAVGDGAVLRPDIDECTFAVQNQGVGISNQSGAGADVGALVRNSWFLRPLRTGVYYTSSRTAGPGRIDLVGCSFDGEFSFAVLADAERPFALTIEGCSFLGAYTTRGVVVRGRHTAGDYAITCRNNVARDLQGAAFAYELDDLGSFVITSEHNLVDRCGAGYVLSAPGMAGFAFRSFADRALRCTGVGMSVLSGARPTASVSIQCGVFADNAGAGLAVGANCPTELRFLTLADNRGSGLVALPITLSAVDHCVFAANTPSEVNGPQLPITWSLFQNQTYPGTGNLQADPRLLRPFYKLARTSPCVDAGDPAAVTPATDYEGDARVLAGAGGTPRADLGADEFVPAGSARPYGVPGFGALAFRPVIGTSDPVARIGAPLTIELGGAIDFGGAPAQAAVLFLGAIEDGGGYPFDLAVVGAVGSFLWQDLVLTVAGVPVSQAGTASVVLPVPSDPTLVDALFTLQWLVVKDRVNAGGFVTTQGLRVMLGR